MLKWLREKGCPWGAKTCTCAAVEGHLEVLKWLRENGCRWNERVCRAAAEHGQLAVLKWAREQGCPWEVSEVIYWAKHSRCNKVIKWVKANGGAQ